MSNIIQKEIDKITMTLAQPYQTTYCKQISSKYNAAKLVCLALEDMLNGIGR